jgi:hypothetical protein
MMQATRKVVEPEAPLPRGPVAPEWQTEARLRSFLQAGEFRIEDIGIKKSTVTAHVKDMVSGMNHFVEAMTVMVPQSWILEECKRLAVELIRFRLPDGENPHGSALGG